MAVIGNRDKYVSSLIVVAVTWTKPLGLNRDKVRAITRQGWRHICGGLALRNRYKNRSKMITIWRQRLRYEFVAVLAKTVTNSYQNVNL